jgi:hypothetical protein
MAAIVCRICPLVEAVTEVVSVVLVEWVESAASAEWVESAVLAVWVESAVWAGLVALAGEIECPPCRAGGAATSGNTIPSIAAGLRTKTGQPQTALAARREAILSPSARRAPGNKLAGKVATWPVPAEGLELAIGADPAWAIGQVEAEPVRAIGLAEAEPTVSEAVTFRAAAVATAMLSAAVLGDIADRALVAAAAAAHLVWDLEAAEAALAVAVGAADGEGK